MQTIENTLFVTTEPAYLHLDHETIVLEQDGQPAKTLPLLAFGGIVLFGDVMISPALLRKCAADGRTITFLERNGRFRARVDGAVSGNVLLRQAQYAAVGTTERALALAQGFVAGKLQNCRQNLLRAARESKDPADESCLRQAAERIAESLQNLPAICDLDTLRGVEGDAARQTFSVFTHMVLANRDTFGIRGRNRRPPLDPMNALLSFLYTLITHDCVSALEGVGLDPQAGYLHTLRPGRPALALDLAEEFRPFLGDRLALTLVNRRQIVPEDFAKRPGGAVVFRDDARRKVLTAFVERKREEVVHPVSGRRVPVATLTHLQARLLARVIRGELEEYPPFVYR